MHRDALDGRIEVYWTWIAWVLFLLVTVDLITTFYAAAVHGVAAESNPVVASLLQRGLGALVIANLVATVLVVVLFDQMLSFIREAVPPFDRMLAVILEIWLGVLFAVGLAVFANNLVVILFGRSLI